MKHVKRMIIHESAEDCLLNQFEIDRTLVYLIHERLDPPPTRKYSEVYAKIVCKIDEIIELINNAPAQ